MTDGMEPKIGVWRAVKAMPTRYIDANANVGVMGWVLTDERLPLHIQWLRTCPNVIVTRSNPEVEEGTIARARFNVYQWSSRWEVQHLDGRPIK